MSRESGSFDFIIPNPTQVHDLRGSIPESSRSAPVKTFSNGALIFNRLPAFVTFLAILLTSGFIGLLLALMVGIHLENARLHPDPLAAFASLWPGQPIENVAVFMAQVQGGGLSCRPPLAHEDSPGLNIQTPGLEAVSLDGETLCASYPKDGVFSMMSLSIKSSHVQTLNLVSSVLPEDVLLLYWGIPDVIKEGGNHLLFLQWQRSTYLATAMISPSDSIVEHITITAR